MPFKVQGVNGETYTVQDAGGDGRIDAAADIKADSQDTTSLEAIKFALDGLTENEFSLTPGTPYTLDKILEEAGKLAPKSKTTQIEKLKNQLERLEESLKQMKAKQKEAKEIGDGAKTRAPHTEAERATATKTATDLAGHITKLEAQLKQLAGELKTAVSADGVADGDTAFYDTFQKNNPTLADPRAKGNGDGFGKGKAGTASVTINSGLPMYATGPGAAPGGPGGGLFGVTPQPTGYPPFDPAAFYQSGLLAQYNNEGIDAIMAQQSKSQKMMMLFFYFAQQAMTGDIGAMYQFVRFITALITKDKAHQNVAMAEKLIQLQDASRKATDIMLNTDAYDPENQEVAANFSKVMERSKADQGEIAVSQKLIAQMLEEFSQVSEAMTGLQKSLLDARGRIMGMESVWRG